MSGPGTPHNRDTATGRALGTLSGAMSLRGDPDAKPEYHECVEVTITLPGMAAWRKLNAGRVERVPILLIAPALLESEEAAWAAWRATPRGVTAGWWPTVTRSAFAAGRASVLGDGEEIA